MATGRLSPPRERQGWCLAVLVQQRTAVRVVHDRQPTAREGRPGALSDSASVQTDVHSSCPPPGPYCRDGAPTTLRPMERQPNTRLADVIGMAGVSPLSLASRSGQCVR